jgi:hypothetical protein
MDCIRTRESILESLIEPLGTERRRAVDEHLAGCENCERFNVAQRRLDVLLAEAFPPVGPRPGFRSALKNRIRRDPVSSWPDFMPDLAHLIGCAAAIAILALALPIYWKTVVYAGGTFTGLTYFLQALLRSSLDSTE